MLAPLWEATRFHSRAETSLNGYQLKIILTDFHFANETLIYSAAEVLTYAVFDGKPTLAMWVPTGESGEFYIKGAKFGTVSVCDGCSNIGFYLEKAGLVVTFEQQEDLLALEVDDKVRLLLLDRSTTYTFFVPALTSHLLVRVDQTGKAFFYPIRITQADL